MVHERGNYYDRALLGRKMELNTRSVIPDLSFNPPPPIYMGAPWS